MANVTYHVTSLLDKMTSTDKDYRFMATNDMMAELQKDSIKLDDDCERKIVKMLLKLLEDKNGEVQNLAVKCLGPLVRKVRELHVELIVDTLCANMTSDVEQFRDISSIGLKTVISELPLTSPNISNSVCLRITGRLCSAIEKQNDVTVQLEALEILSELLSRFGGQLGGFHEKILNALLSQLKSSRQAVRKRAIVALSFFVVTCNHVLYLKLIQFLVSVLEDPKICPQSSLTYIQCLASICRHSGHRFGEHIERIMPLIVDYVSREDDEIREYCLQAFEAFVMKCPKETTPHISTISKICLEGLKHDPNYNYEEEDTRMDFDDSGLDGSNGKGSDDEGVDSSDEYDEDDDDVSWKIRRAAAKCLEAIIQTRYEILPELYRCVSPILISRFKEREENVKCDILHAYTILLKQTKSRSVGEQGSIHDEESAAFLLKQHVPMIMKAIIALLRERSTRTRHHCLLLLKELVHVLPAALSDHIGSLMPGMEMALKDQNPSSSNMKIDMLSFLHCLLITHPSQIFHPYLDVLLPLVVDAIGDQFYKLTAEGLLVLQELVRVMRPLGCPSNENFLKYVEKMYNCTLTRLKAADIDQEVKERAISCMGQIISHFGDDLKNELRECLPIFLDRLKNEMTRLSTVTALKEVAASPLQIDLTPILDHSVPIFAGFLRKNQRHLKMCTLSLLDTLVYNYSHILNANSLHCVLTEIPALLNDGDLHVAQLALVLLTTVAKMQPKTFSPTICQVLMLTVIELVKSPLLQGASLAATLEFFKALAQSRIPGLSYRDLLALLVHPINTSATSMNNENSTLHKKAYQSFAKCVAALSVTQNKETLNVVSKFMQDIPSSISIGRTVFSLFVVGEIGRCMDLSSIVKLKDVVSEMLSADAEEVKSAASYALGGIAIGNMAVYVPFILQQVEQHPSRKYLLLHSLKEIIGFLSASSSGVFQLEVVLPDIWSLLFRHCECAEEGTRNVVAECMGKLTLVNPKLLLPQLQNAMASESALQRTTVLAAVRFTITDHPQAIDPMLRDAITFFLTYLEDADLNVRRVALIVFNSAAHNKPSLIKELLDALLPKLYAETDVKDEYIRDVEMGPFKHTVDDALDIRKAAFECMYTLLEACLDRLDIFTFLLHLEKGLRDHYDIKMLAHVVVARLAILSPTAVLQRLDRLVEPLKQTCNSKVKSNSVKQEYEKQDELKRSAMRALVALQRIPDAEKNPRLTEFLSCVRNNVELRTIYDSVQGDSSGQKGIGYNMDVDLS